MRHLLLKILLAPAVLAMLSWGLAGCSARPKAGLAAKWDSGPSIAADLGEYVLSNPAEPFAPKPPDPALVDAQRALGDRLAALDTKVAAGAVTPEQADRLRALEQKAQDGIDKANTAQAAADKAKYEQDHAPKPGLDFTLPGILAGVTAVGGWLLKRKAAQDAQAAADEAARVAKDHANAAIAAFDALPDDAPVVSAAKVAEITPKVAA